jgi:hypothetical protein
MEPVEDAQQLKRFANRLVITALIILVSGVLVMVQELWVVSSTRLVCYFPAVAMAALAVGFVWCAFKLACDTLLVRRSDPTFFAKREIVAVMWPIDELERATSDIAGNLLNATKRFDEMAAVFYPVAFAVMLWGVCATLLSDLRFVSETLVLFGSVLALVLAGMVHHIIARRVQEGYGGSESGIASVAAFKLALVAAVALPALILMGWAVACHYGPALDALMNCIRASR